MDTVILNGTAYPFPRATNYLDHPEFAIKVPEDGLPARKAVKRIVAHKTIADDPEDVRAGAGPEGPLAERNVHWWRNNHKPGATHFLIDLDGSLIQTADPSVVMAYGAGRANGGAMQFEIVEQPHGVCYEAQFDTALALCELGAQVYGITRQVISVYRRRPMHGLLDSWPVWSGCAEHCDVDSNRGEHDAGKHFRARLVAAGWVAVDLEAIK